jgi:hypothetical protein
LTVLLKVEVLSKKNTTMKEIEKYSLKICITIMRRNAKENKN